MASARALARRFAIAYGDLPSELRSSAHLASLGGYVLRRSARAALLPGGLADAAERLAVAVNRARTREERIGNFVLGRSGAGENLDQAGYEKRLDGFLRDLKEDFLAIQSAFVIIESRNVRLRSAQKKKRQRKAPCRRPDSEAAATKRADLNAIRKEARRRYRDRNAKGRAQTLKQVLEEMYDSFPWGRRCRQWAFPTLYVQVVRNRR